MIVLPWLLLGALSFVDVGELPRAPYRIPRPVWYALGTTSKPGLPSNARKKRRR